jgi:hypothetical protein
VPGMVSRQEDSFPVGIELVSPDALHGQITVAQLHPVSIY